MRWPWVSRTAYDAVCQERDRERQALDFHAHVNAKLTDQAAEAQRQFAAAIAEERDRYDRMVVRFTALLTKPKDEAPQREPEVPLDPEIEAAIREVAGDVTELRREARMYAAALAREGTEPGKISEALWRRFEVEV